MLNNRLNIEKNLWHNLLVELGVRGNGERESGAFLLTGDEVNITHFIPFDDLDPNCLDTSIIRFSSNGFVRLWNVCAEKSLKVIADIHTHPTAWVGMSELDKEHPMIHIKGHIAMIVPYYATRNYATLKKIGVYRYLGKKDWAVCNPKSEFIKII